jgi:6-phosphogluconolactonase (cycloisomerase 2 family)
VRSKPACHAGPGAFAVNVAPNDIVVVSETGSGGNTAAISGFAISSDGQFLYTLNSAGGTLGAFAINADGSLTNLGTTGGLPAGSSLNGIAAN